MKITFKGMIMDRVSNSQADIVFLSNFSDKYSVEFLIS
jgi:hypothetical protein